MITETATQLAFNDAGFEEFLRSRNEPGWLTDQRREAWQTFREKPWPSRREEEWMRTDIRLFKLDKFSLPVEVEPAAELPPPFLSEGVELAGQTISLDSHLQVSELKSEWEERGVLFGNLEELVAQHPDLIRPHLERHVVNPNYDRFSALQAACWSGGTLLYVPRGVTVDEPFYAMSAMSDGGVDLARTLVILEEGAEATLLSEMASNTETDKGFHCGASELIVSDNAHFRFVNLQEWGKGVWHFAHQKGLVARNASLQWTIGAMGGRLAKVNQHVAMVDQGADVQVNGVMFTEGKQHLSYHTLQHHEAPSCHSDFLYKAALQDRSQTVWRGMIKVDKDAQKTDGYQRNDNLLLSQKARADSIPGLEIEADDVRCTHGSTSGRIDDELLFYCQTRGFTRQEAIRAIVTGFFQQVFDRITIESVREALGRAIARRVREYE